MSTTTTDSLPVSLSDDELNSLFRAAQALHRTDRDHLLQLVAIGLRNVAELGDGVLHRTARAAMAELLRSHPVVTHSNNERAGKYGRNGREWIRRPTKRRRPQGGQ